MRTSFVISEVTNGLRRNLTMTIAMVLTTAISLVLLGGGLLVVRTIDHMQDLYYDELEVTVELTEDLSANDPGCVTPACASIRADLEGSPLVERVIFENRQQAYERFKEIFEDSPDLVALARPEALPASFRVQLDDPQRFPAVAEQFAGRPGVSQINDQREFIDDLFNLLSGVRNATFAVAVIQALAAVLLIANTVQLSAFTRRTEVGIMRLVGATRWYTQLPFLIEAAVAGLVGSVLAVVGLTVAKFTFIDRLLGRLFDSGVIPAIGLDDIAIVSPFLVVSGVAVAAFTGYLTLRLYVKL